MVSSAELSRDDYLEGLAGVPARRAVGTTVRGIRAPIVREGDDLVKVVVDALMIAAKVEGFDLHDKDVVGVTESLVARAQGNYATIDEIATDVRQKFDGDIAVVFPLLSRNRFAPILEAIARSGRHVHLILSYPADEVGNHLMEVDALEDSGINPWLDCLTEDQYRRVFGEEVCHPYTGVDYVRAYKELAVDDNITIYLANDARVALDYSQEVLVANIHERHRVKRRLLKAGAKRVLTLDQLLNEPVDGSGYNKKYGLLGANMSTETEVKLFPRDCQPFVTDVQDALRELTGKEIEVMIYGDGAFKDPMGRIWELADPVVSPGYTAGLEGRPVEIKLKFVADSELKHLSGEEASAALKEKLKSGTIGDQSEANQLGTTPRQTTDLLGSLCDLTSGSGEKGTPIVLIQGYFDNYASE